MIRVYLDTNVFIAAFEAQDQRSEAAWAVLGEVTAGTLEAVTSELSLAEHLPKPIRTSDTDLLDGYVRLITTGGSLQVSAVTRRVLVRSAEIRAVHKATRLPDAIHLATALNERCRCVLSSDLRIAMPEGLAFVQLGPDSLEQIRSLAP